METIKVKVRGYRGVTDLVSEYAFVGGSQGDESKSNEIRDYVASQGWMVYVFDDIDVTNQAAIYDEAERRKSANLKYIQKLHKQGRFNEEYFTLLEMEFNPLLDVPQFFELTKAPLSSYKMIFLNN